LKFNLIYKKEVFMKTKELWVSANQDISWDKRKSIVTDALETGADVVMVKPGESGKVRELGKIKTAAEDNNADIIITGKIEALKSAEKAKGRESAFYREIRGKADEEEVGKAGKHADYVIVSAKDWKVIPLENLIAMLQNKCKIIFEVEGVNDAKLALQTMEVGSDGVLVSDAGNLKKIKEFIDDFTTEKLNLMPAKITKIEPVGMGDRVCVDTCSMFSVGEGMLVGSQSNGMFLIHSETIETPYVATRPFRVNAGAVHAYVRVSDGKTKYLSEIKAGDAVLAVDFKGKTRKVIVGRSKIEKRPLMLIEAEAQGKKFSTLLQNAETIRLADKNGKAVSVVDLKVGSEVLAYVEEKGRHFGMIVDESIAEK
jgi:3-dehydroquinate synthase II